MIGLTDDQRAQVLQGSFDELSKVLAATADPELVKSFLSSLLTPREVLDIASRWELVNRIAEGETQRQIAVELGVSLCKITRGSRELKKSDSSFRRMMLLRDTLKSSSSKE